MRPSVVAIICPMIPPIALLVGLELYFAAGGLIYPHGASMLALLLILGVVAMLVPWEIYALAAGTRRLSRSHLLRTRTNYLALLAAAGYVVLVPLWAILYL